MEPHVAQQKTPTVINVMLLPKHHAESRLKVFGELGNGDEQGIDETGVAFPDEGVTLDMSFSEADDKSSKSEYPSRSLRSVEGAPNIYRVDEQAVQTTEPSDDWDRMR